ncbi:AAA domain-containing protein [Akkermansiaceae bacterium]|nr:AAA domain-containing protein [Akkermansiaceae bacterium]MDA7907504.1 AAA domain-containing protein [Akkermansiaceae bacterium]MDA7929439.1 AAA domain-containing protein [Akkermansiaceae bacterium]MDA9830050.1 AAA domain-containing protein [Akkermansiaceae bacterium]MDB4465795.1 AAA domain-containing protein [Akkermansiaceae bacterium]
MNRLKPLISFFRDCLREERSRAGIENIFASRVLNRAFLRGVESATCDEFISVELPSKTKETLINKSQLLRRDTEFLYVTLPITAEKDGRKICCPLLLYPIRISDDELFLSLDQVRINPAVFTVFGVPTSAESSFLDLIPNGVLGPVSPVLLAKELANYLPGLDFTGLDQFPNLKGSSKLRETDTSSAVGIHPSSAVVLTERSKNVAGLLQELEILAQTRDGVMSPPLRAFLNPDDEGSQDEGGKGQPEFIPAMLSDSQLSLIDSINNSTITACQGPPGTGKSFSIAAATTEQILRGRSVLICCRSNEAADVLQVKLGAMVPSSQQIVRAGRKKHLRRLRGMVAKLVSSIVQSPGRYQHGRLKSQIKEAVEGIYRQEEWLRAEIDDALEKGEWFQCPPESWWVKVRKWIHLKKTSQGPLLAQVSETFRELHRKRYEKAREFHRSLHRKNLARALDDKEVRKALRAYQKALGHRYASDQEKALHAIDPRQLLKVFPVWITTTDDLHRVLPLKPGLFDLAIMDEATQCDLPSILPVLYRAKRALITGDPKQLRHISFLSEDRHEQLADQHQLTPREREIFHYRKVSAIDRALQETMGTTSYVLLNEHFRSLPDLIRFSNETFYNGELHMMREPEIFRKDDEVLRFMPVMGERDVRGVNAAEIEAAIALLRRLVKGQTTGSLGFLSPFRAQVDAFTQALHDKLTPNELSVLLKRNQLIAGTGHSFQGDERDGMIISLGVTPDCPAGALRFIERADVFNVAVTRARHWMTVCHSFDAEKLPAKSMLRAYLRQPTGRVGGGMNDPSLLDLIPTLQGLGWEPVSQRRLAGIPVDLLLKNGDSMLAIDLVGTGGEEGEAVPVAKSLILMRSGVPLVPIRIDEWIHRRAEVLVFLKQFGPKSKESNR